MGLSSLLAKTHLHHHTGSSAGDSAQDEDELGPTILAQGQGQVPDGDNSDSESSSDEEEDQEKEREKLARSWEVWVENRTGKTLQLVSWPVLASRSSSSTYHLAPYRGAISHTTLLHPSGSLFLPSEQSESVAAFQLGSTRGPRKRHLLLGKRRRWVWVYLDVVLERKAVHLQLFLKLDRHGIVLATFGRTDLDSTSDDPQSSGQLGEGRIEEQAKRVTFVLDEKLCEVENEVDDSVKKKVIQLRGKGIETNSYMSYQLGRTSLIVGKQARYHEYSDPLHPARLSSLRTSAHRIEGIASRYVGAFVDSNGEPWFSGHVHVHPITGIATGKGMDSTMESVAVFEDNATLCYGFHDAGERRRSQIYLYVTPNLSSWLSNLITSNPLWLSTRFSKLALPASHDSGMYGALDPGLNDLIQDGNLGNLLESEVVGPVVKTLVDLLEGFRLSAARVISNIASTQKDTIMDQLKIGVR